MKAERKRMKICPRPFRLAGYLFWLAAMAVMYLMFRGFLLLFFTAFLCLIPVLSVVSGLVLAKYVRCRVYVPETDALRPGDEVFPVVMLENPLWIGTLDVRIRLRFANTFFQDMSDAGELTVSLPAVSRTFRKTPGESVLRMPLATTRIGHIRIVTDWLEVQDWFGLIRFRVSPGPETEAEFAILPPTGETERPDPESLSSGMTEVEESNRQGNDFSEVTDLREYIPGDRIRDIHWKASARHEEWMVKVRTQMAGMELNVVLLPDRDERLAEEIFNRTYRELRSWTEGETDIHLRVYSALSYGFDSYILSGPKDVDAAFAELLVSHYRMRIPADPSPEGLDAILKNRYPYMGGYIRFGVQPDGSIGWEPVEGMRS